MIALDTLLSNKIEEVLESPHLRGGVASWYSNLFFGGYPVSSCNTSTINHFRHLQLFGKDQQKRLENMKYQLLPGKVIVFSNQTYNSSTITDEIAEDYLAKFPKAVVNFRINKEIKEVKEEDKVEEKKQPVKRGPKSVK